jgi:TRAP transporter TAXI family solute receptor
MKKLSLLFCLVLLISIALSLDVLAEDRKDIGIKTITIVSGPLTGNWYPIGAKIGEIFEREFNIKVTVDIGGSAQNVRRVDAGEDADLGLASTPEVWNAHNGLEPFKKKYENVTVLGALTPYYFQVLVREGSGIHSWKDMWNKRYAPAKAGTGSEMLSRIILEEVGLSYDSIRKAGGAIEFRGYSSAAEAMKDSNLDAMTISTVYPYSVYQEYFLRSKGYFLPVAGELRDNIVKKYPSYSPVQIPAGVYKGQNEPIETIFYWSVIIVRADLPESVVYELTKAIYKNEKDIQKLMTGLKNFGIKEATVWDKIGFHPGAKKYYQEVGAWK